MTTAHLGCSVLKKKHSQEIHLPFFDSRTVHCQAGE